MSNALPIRKVAAGILTSAIVYGAQRLGLHLGPDAVSQAVTPAVGFLAAYLVKDPRVVKIEREAESVIDRIRPYVEVAVRADPKLADEVAKIAHDEAAQVVSTPESATKPDAPSAVPAPPQQ